MKNSKMPAKGRWTLEFARKWWPLMTTPSFLRLLSAHRRQARRGVDASATVDLDLTRPLRAHARIRVYGSDLFSVGEVFADDVYAAVSRLSPCRNIIDLGANIGLASLYFSKRFPDARIVAVEPLPSNAEILRYNLGSLVAAGRCKVLEGAVWDRDDCVLHGMETNGEYCAARIEESRPGRGGIRGFTMRSILEESGFPEVDLLKVDIEGAEVRLFSSNVDWLDRVRALAIEFHGSSRQESRFDTIMSQRGFSLTNENSHTVLALRRCQTARSRTST